MKLLQTPFIGHWRVVAIEFNTAGHWYEEHIPQPGAWTICFTDNGFYNELDRSIGAACGKWSIDEWGIIMIDYDSGMIDKCVFREEGRGTYLYMYDDLRHIAPDPVSIIKHHAFSRYRLEKYQPAATVAN